MEILIALLVALGIVTSEDAKYGKISVEEAKVMSAKMYVDEEVMAKYELTKKDADGKINDLDMVDF